MGINIVKILYVSAKGNKDLLPCLIGCVLGSVISKTAGLGLVTWMVWELNKVVTKSQREQAQLCVSVSPVSVGLVSSGECFAGL